jgi:hypothetical protein
VRQEISPNVIAPRPSLLCRYRSVCTNKDPVLKLDEESVRILQEFSQVCDGEWSALQAARAVYWRNQGQLIRELPEGRNCGAEKCRRGRRDPRFTRSLTDANNRELKLFSVFFLGSEPVNSVHNKFVAVKNIRFLLRRSR